MKLVRFCILCGVREDAPMPEPCDSGPPDAPGGPRHVWGNPETVKD